MSRTLITIIIAVHKATEFIQDTLKDHPFTVAGGTATVTLLYQEQIIRGVISACSVYVAFAVVTMTAWLKFKEIREKAKKSKEEASKINEIV